MLVFRTALLDIPRKKEYTSIKWGGGELTWSAPGYDIGEINPFRYRSYYYDTETGLYYLQSRYYDPVVGRFINADDATVIPQASNILGYNLYSYCENDPKLIDKKSAKFNPDPGDYVDAALEWAFDATMSMEATTTHAFTEDARTAAVRLPDAFKEEFGRRECEIEPYFNHCCYFNFLYYIVVGHTSNIDYIE